MVVNQAQLDWPRQEGCSCRRIEEHKQESINTQPEITDTNDTNIQWGFQRTNWHSGGDQERGPGSL